MIEHVTNVAWLLASSQDSFRVWGRFDHGKSAFGTGQFMLITSAIVVLCAIALVWQRLSQKRQREFTSNSSTRLFHELCRAHRLSRSNRHFLKQLAADRGIETPALLFVEPEYFDTTDVPPRLKSSVNELRQLRAKLFG